MLRLPPRPPVATPTPKPPAPRPIKFVFEVKSEAEFEGLRAMYDAFAKPAPPEPR